tara:strand:+ start:1127 stop:1471 length:345 start_codon:yes stop_codon:yes gene_type:complete
MKKDIDCDENKILYKFKYDYDENYFDILFKKNGTKHWKTYSISRDSCGTNFKRLGWVLQVSKKEWMEEGYEFIKNFAKALDYWLELDKEYVMSEKFIKIRQKISQLSSGLKKDD